MTLEISDEGLVVDGGLEAPVSSPDLALVCNVLRTNSPLRAFKQGEFLCTNWNELE